MKQVIFKVFGHLVVIDDFSGVFFIFQGAFEQVKRTIISVVDQILQIVFERDSQLVPIIILAYFELCFFVMVVKVLERPCLLVPALRATWHY